MMKRSNAELSRFQTEGIGLVLGPSSICKTLLLRAGREQRYFVAAALSGDPALRPTERIRGAIGIGINGSPTGIRHLRGPRGAARAVTISAGCPHGARSSIEAWLAMHAERRDKQLCRKLAASTRACGAGVAEVPEADRRPATALHARAGSPLDFFGARPSIQTSHTTIAAAMRRRDGDRTRDQPTYALAVVKHRRQECRWTSLSTVDPHRGHRRTMARTDGGHRAACLEVLSSLT